MMPFSLAFVTTDYRLQTTDYRLQTTDYRLQTTERFMTFEKRILAGGRAILYRGDSLKMLRAGAFGKVGAIVSDPPYGIGFQHGGGGAGGLVATSCVTRNLEKICGDDEPFDPAPWIAAAPEWLHTETKTLGHKIMLWGADHYMQRLPTGGTMLAWDKHLGRGPDDSFADCEWAWVGRARVKREVFRYLWKGIAANTTPLDVPPSSVKGDGKRFARVHISQKPVELMRWCIDKVRPLPNLPVLDPFMGSGSTALAALSLGHSFIGCEIDPAHFEVACKRVQAYFDGQAPQEAP